MRVINFKNIIYFFFFLIVILSVVFFKKNILEFVKAIFLNYWFNLLLTLIVFALTIYHKFYFNQISLKGFIEVKKIKTSISDVLSLVTDPSTFICSFAIIKGLFLDYYFSYKYFELFKDYEKMFLFIASFFFFINSSIELKDYCTELFINETEEISDVTS